MATLKARLKRVLEPSTAFATGVTRQDTFLDFTEKINNWTISNATMIIDLTMLSFEEAVVSYTSALRCTYVVAFWQSTYPSAMCKTTWGAVIQLDSNIYANCRYWPCCAGYQFAFPKLYVANDSASALLDPNTIVSPAPDGVKYLQLLYGNNNAANPIRIYTTIDIQLYEGNIS